MNILFNNIYSNCYYISNKILDRLTPLQKKVAVLVFAYFGCVTVGYSLYLLYCSRARPLSTENIDHDLEDDLNVLFPQPSSPKIERQAEMTISKLVPITKISSIISKTFFPLEEGANPLKLKIIVTPSPLTTNSPSVTRKPAEDNISNSAGKDLVNEKAQETSPVIEVTLEEEDLKVKEDESIDLFIKKARANEDFLSLLRCMADHPKWVESNLNEATEILQYFGNQVQFLQPIKVVADLYETLLEHHPLLSCSHELKNTAVIFDDNSSYHTHFIFALKNLHMVRDLVEEKMPDFSNAHTEFEIHLPGCPKALKAILQYLDKSDVSEIEKIDFLQLVKIAHLYTIPSVWRYCQTHIENKIPKFFSDTQGTQDWAQQMQLYAGMNTHNVNFIIDYLLLQRKFTSKKIYQQFLQQLSFDDALSVDAQQELKNRILKRLDIVIQSPEMIREEHEDRIMNAIDIIQKLAVRLSKNQQPVFADYLSCSSINQALTTLFRAAIAKQFNQDSINKDQIVKALADIQLREKDLTLDKTWQSFEWDEQEAQGISSLVICLFNYLNQEIPDLIKTCFCWHHESLVLAFNENIGKKTPLSQRVISFAENAVFKPSKSAGFYFLFRPSSRVASSKNFMIFTMTYNLKLSFEENQIGHCRVEAFQDSNTSEWLFRDNGSQDQGLSLHDYIRTKAKKLPLHPVKAPTTSETRISSYINH